MIDQFQPYNLDFPGVRLPEISISIEDKTALGLPESTDNLTYLSHLCIKGYEEKLKKGKIDAKDAQKYADRCKSELETFKKLNLVDYVLLVYDVLGWCDKSGIARGPARGSSACSLVLYLIGCTNIDPILYDLYFTRFVSVARAKSKIIDGIIYVDGKSMPDCDSDLSYYYRDNVLKYINEKYKGKTAKIGTQSCLTGKLLIKEVSKVVLEYSEEEAKEISDLIEKHFGIVQSLESTYKNIPAFKKWADASLKNFECYLLAKSLTDLIKNKSVHPSGVAVSYEIINEFLPLELSSTKDLITSYNMNEVSAQTVKLDILGLKTVDVIAEACKILNINHKDININDQSIYDFLRKKDLFYGLFQIEEGLSKKVIQEVRPRNIKQLAACVSISRPGAFVYIDDYKKFVNEGIIKPFHPLFDNVLEDTGNIIIYQEQINKICMEVYGMSAEDADEIRRCVTPDTKFVSKTRGWITIKKLLTDGYKNDLFLVMDENGRQQWKKIKNIWSTGTHSVDTVRAKNGMYVRATRWHQFLTDTGWKAKNYLEISSDQLVCASSIEFDGQDLISIDMAIIIAGFLTEGYFVEKNSSHFTNFDPEIMNRFVQSFEREFGNNKLHFTNNGKVAHIQTAEKNIIKKILNPGKSNIKIIPEIMMGMTKESMRKFLGFMFSGEGYISERGVSYSSASYQIIQQIQLLLLRYGIRTSRQKKWNSKYERYYYELSIFQYKHVQKFKEELGDYICLEKRKQLEQTCNQNIIKDYSCDIIPPTIIKKFINQYGYLLNYESGHWYKHGIIRRNFKKLIDKSDDPNWKKFINGKQEYYPLESHNELYDRETETFDFTVDDETPFIIANGLIIHNCVGKKLRDEIKKWKPITVDTGEKRGIPNEVTQKFWDTIKKSADYLFNKGHGFSYAIITAQTTYLKANHPKEFFLSLLKMAKYEPNPIEVISKINQELRHFGITLLPPHILHSDIDFKIIGNDIMFGLGSIKGISEKTIEKLNKFRHPHSNKFEIFLGAKEAGLSIGTLASLILVGAMDKGDRSKLVYEAQLFNLLTSNEKQLVTEIGNQFKYNLVTCLKHLRTLKNEKGKSVIKDSRYATLKRDELPYKQMYEYNSKHEKLSTYINERSLLGYSYSVNLIDIYKSSVPNLITIEEVNASLNKERVHFIGEVVKVISRKGKNSGRKYMKAEIRDHTCSCFAMLCDTDKHWKLQEHIDNNGRQMKETDIVVVRGSRGENIVFADCIGIQNVEILSKVSQAKEI